MKLSMYEFLSAIQAGVFDEPITLRHVTPFFDIVLSEYTLFDGMTNDADTVSKALNALVTAIKYHSTNIDGKEDVYIEREKGALIATSASYLFERTPLLSGGNVLFSPKAEGYGEESSLTIDELCNFINQACGSDRVERDDIITALAEQVYDGYDTDSGTLELTYCGIEFDIWYIVK